MNQIYLLSIVYLSLGAAFLLTDFYALKFPMLLSLRYAFRTHKVFRRIMIIGGLLLSLAMGLFPMDPGPRILGDLIPALVVFCLTLWYAYQALRLSDAKQDEQTVLDATGKYLEHNKRNMAFVTIIVAFIHFLAPQLVLL